MKALISAVTVLSLAAAMINAQTNSSDDAAAIKVTALNYGRLMVDWAALWSRVMIGVDAYETTAKPN